MTKERKTWDCVPTLPSISYGTLQFHFFFFFNIFFKILLYFTLQYCIGFAVHQHESTTGVHVFPILNPLPPPSPYHLSGSFQCTSPKHPVPCTELDWRFISYMILYMFQCYSPKSSHLSLSHRVQKPVLYICVSFAVSYTGLSLPSF